MLSLLHPNSENKRKEHLLHRDGLGKWLKSVLRLFKIDKHFGADQGGKHSSCEMEESASSSS
jgi:hypothetical protein